MLPFEDEMKKVFLAGIGAVASTAEKAQDWVEKLVKKGELTVEQGKVLNEELKREFKSTTEKVKESKDDLLDKMNNLNNSELDAISNKIEQLKKDANKKEK